MNEVVDRYHEVAKKTLPVTARIIKRYELLYGNPIKIGEEPDILLFKNRLFSLIEEELKKLPPDEVIDFACKFYVEIAKTAFVKAVKIKSMLGL